MAGYEKYSLKYNPFTAEKHTFPMAGRKRFIRDLKLRLENALKSQTPLMFVVFGPYGQGKTFTLKYLSDHLARKDFIPSSQKVLIVFMKSSYAKPPSQYLLYIYREIAGGLGGLGVKRMTQFSSMAKDVLKEDAESKLREIGVDASFAHAFLQLGGENHEIAWDWLRGEKIRATELKQIQVRYQITDDRHAETALIHLLRICKLLGYKALILLVDEFEYIFSSGERKSLQMTRVFKDFYDLVNEYAKELKIANIISIFASSPGSWAKLSDIMMNQRREGGVDFTPFLQRVVYREDLPPLEQKDTSKLISDRLREARTEGADVKNRAYPFTKESLFYVHEASGGEPRRILRYSSILLDEALDKEQPEISGDFAERILEDLGVVVEIPPKPPRS